MNKLAQLLSAYDQGVGIGVFYVEEMAKEAGKAEEGVKVLNRITEKRAMQAIDQRIVFAKVAAVSNFSNFLVNALAENEDYAAADFVSKVAQEMLREYDASFFSVEKTAEGEPVVNEPAVAIPTALQDVDASDEDAPDEDEVIAAAVQGAAEVIGEAADEDPNSPEIQATAQQVIKEVIENSQEEEEE